MGSLVKDIRYAFRSLLKRPTFAAIVVITLALGIGANTAIFSVVNAVILNPLPFRHPEQVLILGEGTRGGRQPERGSLSMPDFKDLQAQSQMLSYVAAYLNSGSFIGGDNGNSERMFGADVSPEYFDVLGAKAEAGRFFTAAENRAKSDVVV